METVKEMMIALERMIDLHTPSTVLETFANICAEKAEHIRASYNDENLALAWESLEKRLTVAANTATRTIP